MRKSLFSLLFLLLTGALAAQNLKVSVRNDSGEPLSYAYLYVNGKAVAVTDSLGMGVIPGEKLSVGNSVSVSYVGTEPQQTIYDAAMQGRGVWEVVLNEKYRTLTADEVTVSLDIYKLLDKYLRRSFSIFYNNRFNAAFHWEGNKQVTGRFTAEESGRNERQATPSPCTYRNHPLALETSSDTIGVSQKIRSAILSGLQTMTGVNTTFNYLTYGAKTFRERHPNAKLSYLGYRNGLRVFRLTYPQENGAIQFLAFIDPEEKRIKRVEFQAISTQG